MIHISHRATLAIACLLLHVLSGFTTAEELINVTAPQAIATFTLSDANTSVTSTPDGQALQITFGHRAPWPNIRFAGSDVGYSTDWSDAAYLAVTLTNPAKEPVKAGLRIDSTAAAGRGRQATTDLPAQATVRWLMPVTQSDGIIGMRGQPPYPSATEHCITPMHSGVPLNPKEIASFQIFMRHPEKDHVLILHRIELLPKLPATDKSFVDKFGQYNGAVWPGKIQSETEFDERRKQEEEYLAQHGPLADRDQFGGWATGPKLSATGRFQVAKHEGHWWFVDPEGHLFWSSGITGVARLGQPTRIAGREFCFSWLPQKDDPLARFYSGKGARRNYDFFAANLYRKYGPDFEQPFVDITLRRLPAWGINTIANWSQEKTWQQRRLPYVIPVHANVPRFEVEAFLKAGLTKKKLFPDPFDPAYAEGLSKKLAELDAYRGDKWLLGVFVDNELPWTAQPPWGQGKWTGVAAHALAANGPDKPIKKALVERLRKRHETIAALNTAWDTSFASWEALAKPLVLTAEQAERAEADLLDLETLIAETYFQATRDAVKAWDPDALYLGPRFSGRYTKGVVAVAARYCDVVSFNIYEYLPDMREADELALKHDFPIVIGEFHFGALDRGMFHTGLRSATDQQDRAAKYVAYVETAARAPWCVGVHWFQYEDQALTGRADGENYNIGFINGTDDPYPEMIEAARTLHQRLYPLRSQKR